MVEEFHHGSAGSTSFGSEPGSLMDCTSRELKIHLQPEAQRETANRLKKYTVNIYIYIFYIINGLTPWCRQPP